MIRHARCTLTTDQFSALHHVAIDLAKQRGLRRLRVGEVIQEAVVAFLKEHGAQLDHADLPKASS